MKFQYIRQGGLPFGRQYEILPLDNAVFVRDILPLLRPGYAHDLKEWQEMHPELTHYARARDAGGDWRFFRAGPLSDLVPPRSETRVIEVSDWDSPEALEWGARTEVPRARSPRPRKKSRGDHWMNG